MGLVQTHEQEYLRWHLAGGPSPGGNEDWQTILQPAVGGLGADDLLVCHHQLALIPLTSSPPSDLQSAREMARSGSSSGSTILRKAAGQPWTTAYEARNVYIANLPEVLLRMHQCTAEAVYQEWLQCEIIIGKRLRRGWGPAVGGHASRWRQELIFHHEA